MFVCSQRHMRAILWQNLESINSCQINKRCKMQRWTVSSDLLWKISFYAFGRAIYWLITNHLCYVLEAKCKKENYFIYSSCCSKPVRLADFCLNTEDIFCTHKVVGSSVVLQQINWNILQNNCFMCVWQKGGCKVFWPACLQGWRASHGHLADRFSAWLPLMSHSRNVWCSRPSIHLRGSCQGWQMSLASGARLTAAAGPDVNRLGE